jgi:NAD(P)-dependent dehydrogenase (short-subunit alcohol dehydrogenase family)
MTRFKGKASLVTGAAQGMGRAIAQRLLEEGASVVFFDLDADILGSTVNELADLGPGLAVAGDVSRREDVARAVATCVEQFGAIDVLVAQAGIADLCPLLEIQDEDWERILAVNLTGVFRSVQEAGRAMARAGGGSMVVTSSTNAFFVEQHTAHYSATKGGIVTFVRNAALDLGMYGIRVNAVCPGIIRTRLGRPLIEDPVAGPDYLRHVALGRFGEPEEIASAILFLASDEASYITGESLVVDGGATLGVALGIPDASLSGMDA